jgi:hypothetical protein
MKVGDRVYVINSKLFGTISKIDTLPRKNNDTVYFVSFDHNGIGYWFRRNELTEG